MTPRQAQIVANILDGAAVQSFHYDALGTANQPILDGLRRAAGQGRAALVKAFEDSLSTMAAAGTAEIVAGVFACNPGDPVPDTEDGQPPRFRLVGFSELLNRKPPEWTIEGILPRQAIAMLFAPNDSFKSFIAMSMAFAVATGLRWHGRRVQQGPAIYIAGEGGTGLPLRADALRIHYGITPTDDMFAILEEAPRLLEKADADAFTDLMIAVRPRLIICDTLALHVLGGDENSSRDIGLALDVLRRIANATGSSVLGLHHTGKNGDMRGSTAIPGNIETTIEIVKEKNESGLTLHVRKQKDFERQLPLVLRKTIVLTSKADDQGHPLSSLVFELDDVAKVSSKGGMLLRLFELLGDRGPDGATDSSWLQVAKEEGISRAHYYRLKNQLVNESKDVVEIGKGHSKRYIVADYAEKSQPSQIVSFPDLRQSESPDGKSLMSLPPLKGGDNETPDETRQLGMEPGP